MKTFSSASNQDHMSSGMSSAYLSGASDNTSTRSKPKFNRHGYGSPLSVVSPGMSSTAGSDKEKATRKWPKGDNRKKFDVLPNFE